MPSLPSMLINLHRAEGASLFRYLTDSPSYISPIANRWMPTVRALGQAANERLHQLEAFLEATGENSNPVSFPGNFASLHYTSMDYLFGRLLADKRSLAAAYAQAAVSLEQSGGDSVNPALAAFIRDGAAAQAKELAALQALPRRDPL